MEGEDLPTHKDVYHVQGGERINMVRCLEPMVDFLWRNDVRICKFSLGLYHAEGRMIPALKISVHGAISGLLYCITPAKKYPKWNHLSHSNILTKGAQWKEVERGNTFRNWKNYFFRNVNVWSLIWALWGVDHYVSFGSVIGLSELSWWSLKQFEKGDI